MRTLIRNQDLKALFAGAAFAVGMGLIAGAAMQPNLRGEDGPEGPQILAGDSGRRVMAEESASTVFAAYPQTLPDYVIGSDWLNPPKVQDAPVWETVDVPSYEEVAPAYAEAIAAPAAAVAPEAPAAPEAQEQAELEELAVATPG